MNLQTTQILLDVECGLWEGGGVVGQGTGGIVQWEKVGEWRTGVVWESGGMGKVKDGRVVRWGRLGSVGMRKMVE